MLRTFVDVEQLCTVPFAPFRIKLWEGKLREPDIVFMRKEHADRRHGNYWLGADLVTEVLSPDDPKRDREARRREYAITRIPEYWLVEPVAQTVTVFVLEGDADAYSVHGVFSSGADASSATLSGFRVDVGILFDQDA